MGQVSPGLGPRSDPLERDFLLLHGAERGMLPPVSTSWTEYRGQGFWCRDGMAEVWLALMVDDLDLRARRDGPWQERWARRLRDQWYEQVTVIYRGLVASSLDDHLDSEGRREAIVGAMQERRERTAAGQDRPSPRSVARMVGGAVFERERATEQILRVADSFLWLLDGSLTAGQEDDGWWRRPLSEAMVADPEPAARQGTGG
jgi:hypothetical protein